VRDVSHDRLHVYHTDVSDPEAAEVLREAVLSKFGRLDLVVASLGGWRQGGALVHTPLSTWHSVVHDNLTSHVVAARTFLPALLERREGLYVIINGLSAETPYAGAAPVAMMAAALLQMGQILALEHQDSGVRIRELVLGPVRTRARQSSRPDWYQATEIGEFISALYGEPALATAAVHHLSTTKAASSNQ